MMKILLFIIVAVSISMAADEIEFRSLNCDMTIENDILLDEVDSLGEMFSEGEFYGRIRSNNFMTEIDDEIYYGIGLGGSIIYKSAHLHGFGVTAGLYTTVNPYTDDAYAALFIPGRGVFSRYEVLTKDTYGLTSLAQAYMEYTDEISSIQLGRVIFESYLTASNDTKMIPNTFEGITLYTTMIEHAELKAAYLIRQKLRDHTSFHHVLAYGDESNETYSQFSQNDDAAMHRGLVLSKLQAAGIDDRLAVFEMKSDMIDYVTLSANYTAVPELVSSMILQAQTRFDAGVWKVSPAVRYMKQFDEGAGDIGGANLRVKTFGYTDPNSVDAAMLAAKIDLQQEAWMLRLGYSKIADKGDIIAPWRGFPTGGFTRVMSQYNWYANTETLMAQVGYDFEEAGLASGVRGMVRYALQDFDDKKPGVQADSRVLTLDLVKRFDTLPGLLMKARMGHSSGDADIVAGDGTVKIDPSYNELRLEINYLF